MTQNNTIAFEVDASSIGLVTFDQPGRVMNVLTPELLGGFATLLERLEKEDSLKGLVITSGKPTFIVGADIDQLSQITTVEQAFQLGEIGGPPALADGFKNFDRHDAIEPHRPAAVEQHVFAIGPGDDNRPASRGRGENLNHLRPPIRSGGEACAPAHLVKSGGQPRHHLLAATGHLGAAAQGDLQQIEAAQVAGFDLHRRAVLHVVEADVAEHRCAVVARIQRLAGAAGVEHVGAKHARHRLAGLIDIPGVEQRVAGQRVTVRGQHGRRS